MGFTVQNASIPVHGLYTTAIAKNQVSRKGSNAQRRLLYRYRRVLSRTRGAFGSGAAAVESAADSVFARSCGRVGVLVGLDGCEVLLSLIRVLVCALVGPASRARVRGVPGAGPARAPLGVFRTGSTVYRCFGGDAVVLAARARLVWGLLTRHYSRHRTLSQSPLTRESRRSRNCSVDAIGSRDQARFRGCRALARWATSAARNGADTDTAGCKHCLVPCTHFSRRSWRSR